MPWVTPVIVYEETLVSVPVVYWVRARAGTAAKRRIAANAIDRKKFIVVVSFPICVFSSTRLLEPHHAEIPKGQRVAGRCRQLALEIDGEAVGIGIAGGR